jgi:arylsulfatase A-like enzyme
VDRNIGSLLSYLEDHDLFENTLVVIAADHGEGFREHGLEGHARSLYEEVTRVPLIFALPFRLKSGVVVQPLVRNVDIWPTILDVVGLPALPDTDGRSLVPVIEGAARGQSDGTEPTAQAYLDRNWGKREDPSRPVLAIVSKGRRLVRSLGPEEKIELFDHATDPTEQHDISAERPDWVAELRPQLDQQLQQKPPWGQSQEVEIDELNRELLRALGYVVK